MGETYFVWPFIQHDLLESFGGIQCYVSALLDGGSQILAMLDPREHKSKRFPLEDNSNSPPT